MKTAENLGSRMAFVTCLLLIPFTNTAACQEPDTCRNAIYLEVLGPGIVYSINYDYHISQHFGLRAGFSTWSLPGHSRRQDTEIDLVSFPVTANYLSGDGSSQLELGAGVVPINFSWGLFSEVVKKTTVLGTVTIGYRYQPADGGLVFRIGFTPLFNFDVPQPIQPWGGLSIGFAF